MKAPRRVTIPVLALLYAATLTLNGQTQTTRVDLSGAWLMNRELSSPPGGTPEPGLRARGSGRGDGGGMRGSMGGRGGMGRSGSTGGGRPNEDEMRRTQALMQELAQLPLRFTIIQDGDQVSVAEPDGVVRKYVANGRSEKHQLTNGTIETKTKWEGPLLEMEIKAGDRLGLVRTYAIRNNPRRLEVVTRFQSGARDEARTAVYDPEGSQ